MWDPNIGLGTVTHQNIGYLWPMGPWYWSSSTLGVPDWVAQRLWLGIDHVPGRPRRPLPPAHPRPGRAARHRGDVRLRAVALRPVAGGAHLGDPAAVRRAAVADRAHRPRDPRTDVAVPGPLRARDRDHRQHERHRPPARRARSRRSGWATRCSSPGRPRLRQALGAVARIGVLTVGASLWWMAGPLLPGLLRHRHPPLHRDRPDRGRGVDRRPRCSAASATGSSTAATRSARGSSRRVPYTQSLRAALRHLPPRVPRACSPPA